MTIVDSRLKKGKLTFATQAAPTIAVMDVSCQATSVILEPSKDEQGDPVEVLCGDAVAAVSITTWTMNLTAIQDFDSDGTGTSQSFVLWALENDGTTFAYTWQPNETSGTFSGTVVVSAVSIGGEVALRLTTETEWSINGKPLYTAPTPSVPSVDSVVPATGAAAGGNQVVVNGSGFSVANLSVKFGTTAGTGITDLTDAHFTVTVPAGTAGAVDVVVTTDGGTDTLTGGYTYTA